ncbi:hypothetical protein G5C60_11610 [Streptomyces sp. HC44]|uniref:Uncharacterized protein n=1 Tax=Streptomyces scabichelini TaxID=2711217 RepID=A0A6G4V2H6_9ACTN|nr:hypothetical protein [Streptomyces scabichelini]NGO08268.1 hypothetical protein [Streptomyces scabichelini]
MTDSTGAETHGSRGAFYLDSPTPGAAPREFDAFRRGWQTQIGDVFIVPPFSPATITDFRLNGRVTRVRDAAIGNLHSASAAGTTDTPGGVR